MRPGGGLNARSLLERRTIRARHAKADTVSATDPRPVPAAYPLPSGTVTFAFTDIEGSTQRWDRNKAALQDALRPHDELMRAAIAGHSGYVFKIIDDVNVTM